MQQTELFQAIIFKFQRPNKTGLVHIRQVENFKVNSVESTDKMQPLKVTLAPVKTVKIWLFKKIYK